MKGISDVASCGSPKGKHLRRLAEVWLPERDFWVTVCARGRKRILASQEVNEILSDEWGKSMDLRGWAIGPYVVMPDHVHFFCRDVGQTHSLSVCVGKWKEWTSKRLVLQHGFSAPVWQREFFDHLLRSDESCRAKWEYIRMNPVRAGLARRPEDWAYQGHVHYDL